MASNTIYMNSEAILRPKQTEKTVPINFPFIDNTSHEYTIYRQTTVEFIWRCGHLKWRSSPCSSNWEARTRTAHSCIIHILYFAVDLCSICTLNVAFRFIYYFYFMLHALCISAINNFRLTFLSWIHSCIIRVSKLTTDRLCIYFLFALFFSSLICCCWVLMILHYRCRQMSSLRRRHVRMNGVHCPDLRDVLLDNKKKYFQ